MSEEQLQGEMPENTDGKKQEEKKEEKERYTLWNLLTDFLDIAETAVITIFVFLMAFAYLFREVTVDGSSMVPTLRNGDSLLVVNSFIPPRNGQIVVINDEEGAVFSDSAQTALQVTHGLDMVIVKRLIAKGGQTVDIDFENGNVAVDGVQLAEDYVAELTYRNDGAFMYPVTVPEGYLFVMGDNRNGSTDSRNPSVGLIPENELIGTVLMRYDRDKELISGWKERFDWLYF